MKNLKNRKVIYSIFGVLLILALITGVVVAVMLKQQANQEKKENTEKVQTNIDAYESHLTEVNTLLVQVTSEESKTAFPEGLRDSINRSILQAEKNKEAMVEVEKEPFSGTNKKIAEGYNKSLESLNSGLNYIDMVVCLNPKFVEYEDAYNTAKDNITRYIYVQNSGDFSPTITEYEKNIENLNVLSDKTNSFYDCFSDTDFEYISYLSADLQEIRDFIGEYAEPFIEKLRTGDQTTIQNFLNNHVAALQTEPSVLWLTWNGQVEENSALDKYKKAEIEELKTRISDSEKELEDLKGDLEI